MPDRDTSIPIVIIGTGFGGTGMAIRLRQAGYTRVSGHQPEQSESGYRSRSSC